MLLPPHSPPLCKALLSPKQKQDSVNQSAGPSVGGILVTIDLVRSHHACAPPHSQVLPFP